MRKSQGFTVAEGALILVIVGIVAGTGWYVWNSHNKANNSLNNADSTSRSATSPSLKKSSSRNTVDELNSVSSSDCNYSTAKSDTASLVAYINATPEIKALEKEEASNIKYITGVGSVCTLSNKDLLISFSHEKEITNQDQTIDSKLNYGLIALSDKGIVKVANTDLQCAYIPPSPSNPPEIKSVTKGKVTINCPGYTGAIYAYDFHTGIYTKIGQSKAPDCLEGICQ